MRIFRRTRKGTAKPGGRIRSITEEVLDMIFEASADTHPHEFIGVLRARGGVVGELVLLPGTTSGDSHATFMRHMLPFDPSVVGTVHSHPSPAPYPSDADLHLFERFGKVHIICAYPYDMDSWLAYDSNGEEFDLQVAWKEG